MRSAGQLVLIAVLLLAACEPATTSEPSTSWARITLGDIPPTGGLDDVIVFDNAFLTGGYSSERAILLRSLDGGAWNDLSANIEGNAPNTSLVALASTDEVSIALLGRDTTSIERDLALRISLDGMTWSKVGQGVVDGPKGVDPVDVEASETGFVALGSQSTGEEGTARINAVILRSPDGEQWTRDTSPALILSFPTIPEDLTVSGATTYFVADRASGGGGTLLSHDSDKGWLSRTPDVFRDSRLYAIEATRWGVLVGGCVMQDGRPAAPAVWASPGIDGPFARVRLDERPGCVEAFAEGAGEVLALGYVGPEGAIWSSTDGASWEPDGAGEGFLGRVGVRVTAAVNAGSEWVAVGRELASRPSESDVLAIWRR